MLIKAVPYYPVLMRNAHRVSHHFNVATAGSRKEHKEKSNAENRKVL